MDRMRFTNVSKVLWQGHDRWACQVDRRTGHGAILPRASSSAQQRRRSTLEFHRFQRRADSQRMSPERRRLTHALLLSLLIHTLLLSLTFGGQGLCSGLRLPLAGSTDRGTRSARRSRSGAGHSRGAGGHAGRGAVAAGMGRAACCQWAGADAIRVPCADPAADCSSDRAGGQSARRRQSKDRRRDRCGPCANAFARRSARRHGAPADPRAGRDRRGADRRGHVGRARHSSDANARHRGSAKRLEPGDRDAVASRCWRCSAGANRPRGGGASR